ncbi:MAG: pilin [Pseudomonadota bacterium]
MDLVYKHEKKLFAIAVIVATLFWLVLIGVTFGIALVYVLIGLLFYLFAQSGFISHIKGNGVKISEEQYPELHRSLTKCCQKVGVETPPDMYLLRTDFFNALATKFLGRNFIVLFTDVVDALAEKPSAVDFYVGHELGHIHRKHLRWSGFLFPALLLPVLGTAYRRAQEYTCDRYGAYCCESDDDVRAALAAISAGDSRWKDLNASSYLSQIDVTREFWMSFHELTNDYPWLTKRMASALAFRRDEEIRHPRRHFLAGLLSLFVPRIGAGGGLSLIITVAMIGILAAIAIPAYQDYTIRSQVSEGFSIATDAKIAVTNFAIDQQEWPVDNVTAGLPPAVDISGKYVRSVLVDEGAVVVTFGNDANQAIQGKSLIHVPDTSDFPNVIWECYSSEIDRQWLPKACRND